MRYFIYLSYKGSAFSGWQIQENANSVQQELQNALTILLKEPISVTGAGRTDAGVNAINFVAHFDSREAIQKISLLIYKLNAILPREITIHKLLQVHDTAHARFDAISRTYRYYIHLNKDPFCGDFSLYIKGGKIDIGKMNEAAGYFLGTRDFSSMEKVNGGSRTSICTVTSAAWKEIGEGKFVFEVTANRFLRNMVRAMVGTLLEVGLGKREPQWVEEILRSRQRNMAGQSVPGTPLFLTEIKYPY